MFDFVRNLSKSAAEKRQEALSAYLDEALSARQRQAFEQQLAGDADLRRELEIQRLIRQQMRALPQRSVPRSFTLDPAVYGAPRKEPLVQAYPVLRAATALTAVFFIVALTFSLINLGSFGGSTAMAPLAADTALQESEIAAAPEMPAPEAAADTAVAESASGAMPAAEAPVETTRIVTEEAAEEATAAEMPAGEAGLALAAPTGTPAPTTTPSELPRPEATVLADSARAATLAPYEAESANVAVPQATAVSPLPTAPSPTPPVWWLAAASGGLLLILLILVLFARRRL